ncbi:MAG: DUF11 domain-containing protein [Clostridia bacterium]|nr:DUF11 domain-containing protein [Clostridia bacterium]
MATIENFATVRYTSGGVEATRVSNLAEIALESSAILTKTPLSPVYEEEDTLTYILSIQNTSGAALTNLRVEDDLGTFPFGTTELTPLTYAGNAILLIDGQIATAQLDVDSSSPSELIFTVASLPAGATANIVYNARINEFAPLGLNATVVNTATLSADAECVDGTASATVRVVSGADISVLKQMSPNPVVCGDTLTYSIQIYNYGNEAAENVRLTDVFNPAPESITVTRNGVSVPATDYTYENGVLTVPADTADGDTVPAATFTRNPETGEVTVTPGMVEYIITGTI